MEIQLFHLTRMPGRHKINDIERCKKFRPIGKLDFFYFFSTHYDYIEETRQIRHKSLVILILCNNCNGHKIDPENCEFILDSENRIFGISFKMPEIKSVTHYMVKNYLTLSIPWDFAENWQPFFWNNNEKFYQTYEISKEFDFNYITPFTYKQRPIGFHRSAPPPSCESDVYLSIFCPVSEKEIQLSFKNKYEQTTTVNYVAGLCFVFLQSIVWICPNGQYAQPTRNQTR